jgi:hypothetical protein
MTAARPSAACTCGMAFPGPWELAAHLLEAFPPKAPAPPGSQPHADATTLAAKLNSIALWEVVTWAGSQRKDLRVAAAITCTARAGVLTPGQEILGTEVRSAYGVSLHTARAAIWILEDFGIARKYGARYNLEHGDISQTLSRHATGTILDQIARHLAALEDRMSAIEDHAPAARAEP